MVDIEKVIKGLECCYIRTDDPQTVKCKCHDCPYENDDILGRRCHVELCEDALELLKAQRETIDGLISADKALKQIVRCKDCKFYEKCEINDFFIEHENGFFSDGERKVDG